MERWNWDSLGHTGTIGEVVVRDQGDRNRNPKDTETGDGGERLVVKTEDDPRKRRREEKTKERSCKEKEREEGR